MKLRLESNNLRLRVRKSDLQKLMQNGSIGDTLTFPNATVFSYELMSAVVECLEATFSEGKITVSIPLSILSDWVNSEQVGIEATLDSGLFVLIEKDFPCKDRPTEDKSDTFFELVNDAKTKC